jgi:hypothetical protein
MGFALSPGERGISETLAAMSAVVHQASKTSSLIDRTAAALAARIGPGESRGALLRVLYGFLADHLTYKDDPIGTEKLRHPDQLLAEIAKGGRTAADCDDVATLGASLAAAMGFRPVFLVTGRPGDIDRSTGRIKLSHVFYGIDAGRAGTIPFDPQEKIPPGKWPPREYVGRIERYIIFPR